MRCIPFSLSLFVLLGHDRVKSLLDLEHAVSSPSSPGSSPWSDATEGVVATATNSIFSVARRCVIVLESYPLSSESFVSCDHHSPTLTPSLPPSLYVASSFSRSIVLKEGPMALFHGVSSMVYSTIFRSIPNHPHSSLLPPLLANLLPVILATLLSLPFLSSFRPSFPFLYGIYL